jgi:hypothetical protein
LKAENSITTEITEITEVRTRRKIEMEEIDLNELYRITERIIGAAIEVHRTLGPGLLDCNSPAVRSDF